VTGRAQLPSRRVALVIAIGATFMLLCCGGVTSFFFMDQITQQTNSNAFSLNCGNTSLVNVSGKLPRAGSLGDQQMHNAAVIVSVGQQMKVPPRGWVVAIATALQESALNNLGDLGANNDHDSLGLFQQRPSQGWGTPAQIMDPQYSSHKFYEKLLTIHGWETMALTDAAQAVQNSAFPDAYAKHEPLATTVVNLLTNGAARAVGALANIQCVDAGQIAASGWTVPVRGPINSGFRPPSRPTHNGVDLGVPKWTEIHAAAAGVVITAQCDVLAEADCNHDGSSSTKGCGWYVNIMHAGGVMTRYCHMVVRPFVVPGQVVAAGAVIGRSGSSGNSSGPHVHFEVHLNGDRTFNGAIDPVPFMEQVGAPLGLKQA
jgi:murein DD-endopeptidase MepM/ murein hydrolase activator NlpD